MTAVKVEGMEANKTIESMPLPTVNLERLKKDILDLGMIGRNTDDRGIYRMAFSDADMEGKRWLKTRMEEAGLTVRQDGAANLFGRLEGHEPDAPVLLVGSHIDTVPCAGSLDGTLGVLTGLEALRVMAASGDKPRCPIELVAFSDEEGRFGGMFGSQAFCGRITPETLHARNDIDGVTLEEAMRRQGLNPMDALDAACDPASLRGYLEVHIEQGPVLDRLGKDLGIVESITGLFKWNVTLTGTPNHAGTTPMEMRNDAFMGLADFAHEIPRILAEYGSEASRATIGRAELHPGAANTIPGKVNFSLDVRDTDADVLEALRDAIRRALSAIARRRDLMFEFDAISSIAPVTCDPGLVTRLESSAKALGYSTLRMPSGAAHDAQIMAAITPTVMLFVPSKDGQSHSPAEWSDWHHIYGAAHTLLHALLHLSR